MNGQSLREPAALTQLRDEIHRNQDSRYNHRLHALLLVAQGMSCRKAAALLGDSPRSVQYWVSQFEQDGLQGLAEGVHTGRPSRLTESQKQEIDEVLRGTPEGVDLSGTIWDGKLLSAYIKRRYGVELGVRQCQRMFRILGFR